MPDNVVNFAFVTEGEGEVAALPLLVRRICYELLGFFAVKTARPVRITKSRLIRAGELERAIRLARSTIPADGPVLVVLDADEDCPALLGPSLKARIESDDISIVIPKYEFETWFVTAAASLAGKHGLRPWLSPPPDPETVRGAKEWLTRNMGPGHIYSPTIDQAALVAGMDLTAARSCRSFERLCREIQRLIASC